MYLSIKKSNKTIRSKPRKVYPYQILFSRKTSRTTTRFSVWVLNNNLLLSNLTWPYDLRRWKSTRQPNLGSTLSGNYANTVTDLPIVIFYEKNFRPFRAFLFFSQQWIPNHMRMPSILKKVVKMLQLEKDASERNKSYSTGKGRLRVQNDPLEFLSNFLIKFLLRFKVKFRRKFAIFRSLWKISKIPTDNFVLVTCPFQSNMICFSRKRPSRVGAYWLPFSKCLAFSIGSVFTAEKKLKMFLKVWSFFTNYDYRLICNSIYVISAQSWS